MTSEAKTPRPFCADRIRVAAFDLDGTVLDRGVMSEATGDALRSLSERGIAVVVCTSRDISQIPPYVLSCFGYRVTANGANVSDSEGNVLLDRPMEPRTAFETLKKLHRLKGRSCLYLNGFVMASPAFLVRLLRKTEYMSKSHRKAVKGVGGKAIRFRIGRYVKKHKRGVYRIHTLFRNEEEARTASDALTQEGVCTPVLLSDNSIETTLYGVTKADGLSRLCSILGCTMDNVIAFGDSANDLLMLESSGYAVGMGNSEDCVKPRVDFITSGVSEDGVAEAIRKLFNI